MKRAVLAALLLTAAAPAVAPAVALAGVTACRIDRGVLVAPGEVAGLAGDFIIDTGQAATQLYDERAREHGYEQPTFQGVVQIAGVKLTGVDVAAVDLDARTVFLSTPIAGVIGLDVLKTFVVDVSFSPCRLSIQAPGAAAPFASGREMEMGWRGGLPVVLATVGDGATAWPGAFTPSTGLDLSLRLDDRLASAPAAAKPRELYPGGVWRAVLESFQFAGDTYRGLDTGLLKGASETVEPAGVIGGPVLQRYRLRFDFPAGRLFLADPRAAPAVAEARGVSAPRCARSSYSSPKAGRRRSAGRSSRPGRTACAPRA